MKKSSKIIIGAAGAALALTAADFAAGALLYRSILNMDVKRKSMEKGPRDPVTNKIYVESPASIEGDRWWEEIAPKTVEFPAHDRGSVRAYLIEQPGYTDKWAVCCHGYTSSPRGHAPYAKIFYELGFNVLIPCMTGHDLDGNLYCSMGNRDRYYAREAVFYVTARDPMARIVLQGTSMGAATTLMATALDLPSNVKCAVADCAFTSVWDEYSFVMKNMGLPAFPLLHTANAVSVLSGNLNFKKCSPEKAVTRSRVPTLFIHGTHDDFVPFAMLDRLYRACAAPKEVVRIPGALHAVSVMIAPEKYGPAVADWTAKYIP